MVHHRVEDLTTVFHPSSIAVVGASADQRKSGAKWIQGLRAAGYRGALYPVSAGGRQHRRP